MRWDDGEKKMCFLGKNVCLNGLFENVVVGIHAYGHPGVDKTVKLLD